LIYFALPDSINAKGVIHFQVTRQLYLTVYAFMKPFEYTSGECHMACGILPVLAAGSCSGHDAIQRLCPSPVNTSSKPYGKPT